MLNNNSTNKYWSYISISIISVTVLFFGLFDLRSNLVSFIANQDKYLHFLTFFFLVFILKALFRQMIAIYIGLAVLGFGLLLEILQELFTDTRHFHFSDILANIAGIVIATFLVWLIERKKNSSLAE